MESWFLPVGERLRHWKGFELIFWKIPDKIRLLFRANWLELAGSYQVIL